MNRGWKHENITRSWYTNFPAATVEDLLHMCKRLYMPRILIVAPTNNAFDVIYELLLDFIP